jgi:hypothetical protein
MNAKQEFLEHITDSYSDRGEYDGSEWWENHKMPIIQEVLNPVKE